MSDPNQNQPPEDDGTPPPPPAGQSYPPPPPPPGQGSYGTNQPGGWQQPGAMPPPPQTSGGIGQPADLWPRFAARLIDYILLTLVNVFIVGFVIVGMLVGTGGGTPTGFGMDNGTTWAANAIYTVLAAAIALGYFTLMEANRGQTIGKMLLKLQTRGPDGGNPTFEQALKRNAFTAIGVLGIIPFLGFLAGLLSLVAVIMIAVTISKNTATRRGWHDDFAGGTQVIKVG
jgi:uncharacterized RDD family membrane protein YckC